MTVVYFKTGASSPVRLLCSSDGKIDFEELGRMLSLVPTSILLNGLGCPKEGLKSEDTWEKIKADLVKEGDPLGEEDCPVVVTGESAVSTGISLSERRKCEFDFSILNTRKSGDVLGTTVIADASEKFGGFPRRYYVRLEETMVFQNCLNSLKKQSKLRALILGSSGVCKSVFLALFAFYLAHVESKSVIILQKLKEVGPGGYACVHVSKKGSSGSRLDDLAAYPGIRSLLLSDGSNLEETLLFLDGFIQDDINRDHGILGCFNLLATSSQYLVKSDDGHTRCILLPAWRSEDLPLYAKRMKTFSSDESELSSDESELSSDESKLSSEEFEEKFQYAYSYSGGILREFLRDEDRENLFRTAMNRISGDGVQALLSKYGAGSKLQGDTIRKLYVTDPSNVEHYITVSEYIPTVDSTVALGELRDRFSEADFQTILTAGQSIGGAFLGLAFEWLIHKTATLNLIISVG